MPAVLDASDATAARDPQVDGGGDLPPPDDFDNDDGGGGGDDESDDGDDFHSARVEWVTLAAFWHPAEAHIARLRLEAAGVACVLLDELTAATNVFAIAVGGVKLQVPRSQSSRAAKLLRDVRQENEPQVVAVARFGRLIDAKAAACVVEAAGLTAEVAALHVQAPALAAYLPPRLVALLWPTAELRVAPADQAAAVAALQGTPYAVRTRVPREGAK